MIRKIFHTHWSGLFVIFLITVFISQVNLPLINNVGLIPDYFLALSVALIAERFKKLNILAIFLLGIVVDFLVGELLGQYALTFILMFMANYVLHRFFKYESSSQKLFLYIFLFELGFFTLILTSLSFQLNIFSFDILIYKSLITLPFCFLYSVLFEQLTSFVDAK